MFLQGIVQANQIATTAQILKEQAVSFISMALGWTITTALLSMDWLLVITHPLNGTLTIAASSQVI